MMSHYGLPFEYDDNWLCGALELSIETLAGTAFEIKVSPNDTIMAIKSKIQSVEGIPVSQQHLLYNLEELDNSASVRDYSIRNGATLKLVLSMRGGPISTKKLPPVDEMAWSELQELISVTRKDDMFNKLPSGSRVTVLVFRDGDQVNLLRVVENEDGSFSPLSESWNGSSVRNLFTEEDPEQYAKRLQENSVTMGKMQELKEKLEALSIQRKEKKCEDAMSLEVTPPNTEPYISENASVSEGLPPNAFINFPSGDCSHTSCVQLIRRTEQEPEEPLSLRPRSRLVSCNKAAVAALTKARKEAENIIRMQSNLSVLVESESNQGFRLRRTPLPDIRRCARLEKEKKKSDEEDLGKNLRKKTARNFTMVERDFSVAPRICSSRSSVVALPLNEVTIAYSQIPREGLTAAVTRSKSRFRVSKYVLDHDERPKTTPAKLDSREPSSQSSRQFCNLVEEQEAGKRPTQALSAVSHHMPETSSKNQTQLYEHADDEDKKSDPSGNQQKNRASTQITNPSSGEVSIPLPASSSQKPLPPVIKKRLRCSNCNKKLNITNTYTCRCGLMFCAIHRYSELHDCLFDYKEEGRRILQQTNPLVAASKLPKI